ncbi:hypothetical protein I4U23_003163 [Adineta vaga]|nr:hypothetical protein I4U23_003163 [Adineta vaga]
MSWRYLSNPESIDGHMNKIDSIQMVIVNIIYYIEIDLVQHSINKVHGHELFFNNPILALTYHGHFDYNHNIPSFRQQPSGK